MIQKTLILKIEGIEEAKKIIEELSEKLGEAKELMESLERIELTISQGEREEE